MSKLHQSKLLQSLRGLSKHELEDFQAYIRCPLFNTREQSIKLMAFLAQFAPSYQAEGLNQEEIYAAIYGDMGYSHPQFKIEFSHLFRLLQRFLAYIELRSRPEEETLLSLVQLRKRQVGKVFTAQKNALEKRLSVVKQANNLPTETRLRLQFQLKGEIEQFHGQRQSRTEELSVTEKTASLDAFYCYQKLRAGCEMLNRKNILAKKASMIQLEEVHSFASQSTDAAIILYRHVYACLKEPDDLTHYTQLIQQLSTLQHALPQEEARAMYKYAQNYCIARINKGERTFLEEIFSLYQSQLDSGLLLTNDQISQYDYSNIVTAALRLRQFEWAKVFIENYRLKLLPRFQDDIYQYNLASVFFEQKQYGAAMRLLQASEIDDPFFENSRKVLLCKVYFESEEWDALSYLIEAFKRYLTRSKTFSQQHRTHYKHFLRHLKALMLLHEKRSLMTEIEFKLRLQKIADRITEDQHLSNRLWLEQHC